MSYFFAKFMFVVTAMLLHPLGCVFLADDDAAQQLQREFNQNIKPLLQAKCSDCHNSIEMNAGINFDAVQSFEQILEADRKWSAVINEITTGTMPPEDSQPLSEQQQQQLLSWVHAILNLVDCSQINPGNVTIRKLNREEYRNSVRDLLGVDYQPAKDFPGDDIGNGFDNIADVITLPPILMEKYLDAAETITQIAIVDPENPVLDVELFGASFIPEADLSYRKNGRLSFLTDGIASKKISFPLPGTYKIEVRAYGDQAGEEFAKMSVLIDGQLLDTVEVKSNSRKPSKHGLEFVVRSDGSKNVQVRFDNDYYVRRVVGKQDRNLHILSVRIEGPVAVSPTLEYLDFENHRAESAAEDFIDSFLFHAFRRPVSKNHKKRFLQLFQDSRQDGQSFYEAIRSVTQAALISPQFLYKLQEPVAANQTRHLDDFERATALSYFLWSSTPDDELLDLAKNGQLSDKLIWQQQISRLFESPQSISLVDNFASQWLNLRTLASVQLDPDKFPNIDHQFLSDMETETRMVVADIFRRDASVLELLESDFSFVNDQLARHYGLANIKGNEFRRISLPDENRRGLLTHASILTLTSNPNRTSPVKRGKWIMENILGDEPPPLPPTDVTPLDEQTELTGSLRQRMQRHRTDPSCASCHVTMDALGFALENFDAVGRFRLMDDGFEIDANSELPDGTHIAGATGLQKHLRTTYRSKFIRCFTEKMLTFALGRGLKYYDRCTVNAIMERAAKNDYRISEFVLAIAESDPFLKRSGRRTIEEAK